MALELLLTPAEEIGKLGHRDGSVELEVGADGVLANTLLHHVHEQLALLPGGLLAQVLPDSIKV